MQVEWNEILREGEKLLWQGKAESFTTMDSIHKPVFIRKLIVSVAIVLAICIAYVVAAGAENVKPLMIVIIAALGLISPINTFRDASALRKITYAATDTRLITITDGPRSVAYDQIKEAVIKKDTEGHTCLLCGKDAVKSKQTRWREFAVAGIIIVGEDNPVCDRFAMYGIDDAAGLKAVLREKLPCLKA